MDHSMNPAPEDAESSRGSRPTSAPLPPHSLFAHRRRAGHSRRSEIVRDPLAGDLVKMLVSSINKRRMTSVPGTKRCHPPTREGVWSTRVGARIELRLSGPCLVAGAALPSWFPREGRRSPHTRSRGTWRATSETRLPADLRALPRTSRPAKGAQTDPRVTPMIDAVRRSLTSD